MSSEKIRLLRAFGAEVVVVPTAVPPDHPEYYIQKAKAIVARTPGAIFANQHYNPDNPEAHYRTTGPEIWEQTRGKVTHFVCSPGTGGTVTGVGTVPEGEEPGGAGGGRRPRGLHLLRVRAHPHQGRGRAVQGGGDRRGQDPDVASTSTVVDEWMTVSDADAFRTSRRLTREEGIFIGGSGGLNVFTALEVARRLDDPAALVVTILCDTGERYLSKLYDDTWMRENQMMEAERVNAGQLLARHPEEVPPLVSVAPSANVRQALNLLSTWGLSQLPVVDGDDCVGSVAEGLMARVLEDGKAARPAGVRGDAAPFPVVDADVPLDRLVTLLSRETPAALVRDGGRLVGHRQPLRRPARGRGDRLKRPLGPASGPRARTTSLPWPKQNARRPRTPATRSRGDPSSRPVPLPDHFTAQQLDHHGIGSGLRLAQRCVQPAEQGTGPAPVLCAAGRGHGYQEAPVLEGYDRCHRLTEADLRVGRLPRLGCGHSHRSGFGANWMVTGSAPGFAVEAFTGAGFGAGAGSL